MWISSASPDGLIGDSIIVEIKCLHSLHKSGMTISDALLQKKPNFCLEERKGNITLKKNHNYYYQVQEQLNITGRQQCYFIVYINDESPLLVLVIDRDKEFWENDMRPKLKEFYLTHMLPEIVQNL